MLWVDGSFSFGLFQVNQPFVFGSVSTDTPLSVMGVNFGGFADVATWGVWELYITEYRGGLSKIVVYSGTPNKSLCQCDLLAAHKITGLPNHFPYEGLQPWNPVYVQLSWLYMFCFGWEDISTSWTLGVPTILGVALMYQCNCPIPLYQSIYHLGVDREYATIFHFKIYSWWWFQIFVYFYPYLWKIPMLVKDIFFANGLVQPPPR